MIPSIVIPALETNVFYSPFLLNLCMCAQRIESVYMCPLYLLSIQYQSPAALEINPDKLSFIFPTFVPLLSLCFHI